MYVKMYAFSHQGKLTDAHLVACFDSTSQRDEFIASTPKTRKWRADDHSSLNPVAFIHVTWRRPPANTAGAKRILAAEQDITSRGGSILWSPIGVPMHVDFLRMLGVSS